MTLFGISIEVYIINLIMGIFLYLILRVLSKKYDLKFLKKNPLKILITISLTPLIYISLILLFIFYTSYYPNRKFDQRNWISNEEKRYEMANNLIESKILIAKTKKEIVEFLGSTDTSGVNVYYDIGFLPGLINIDPDILLVEFKNGKVIKVTQIQS